MTAYNPQYHSSVVKNIRAAFKAECDHECRLTDEQIWCIFDNITAPTGDEQTEWCIEEMAETEPLEDK